MSIPNPLDLWREWRAKKQAPATASENVHSLSPAELAADGITIKPVMVGPEDATLGIIPPHPGLTPQSLHDALPEAPAKAEESNMSIETKIADLGGDIKGLFSKAAAEYQKLKQAWVLIASPQTRAFLIQVGADALKATKDVTAAAAAGGANIALDAQVVADGKAIWADALAGDGILQADLKILGLTL